jgi:hypothetical protein
MLEDHHGPLALVEPADGYQFMGIGEDREQQPAMEETKHHKKRT